MAIRISTTGTRTTGLYGEDGAKQDRRLTAQDVERLAGVSRGDTIVATCGVLWVTQEGDPADYMLQTGERFTVNRHGMVVVEALTDATFRVSKN